MGHELASVLVRVHEMANGIGLGPGLGLVVRWRIVLAMMRREMSRVVRFYNPSYLVLEMERYSRRDYTNSGSVFDQTTNQNTHVVTEGIRTSASFIEKPLKLLDLGLGRPFEGKKLALGIG